MKVRNNTLGQVMVQNVCNVTDKLGLPTTGRYFYVRATRKFFELVLKAELWHTKKE